MPKARKKLRGKAKAEFLARMERGRKAAARRRGKAVPRRKTSSAKGGRRATRRGAVSSKRRRNETLMTLLSNPSVGKAVRGAVERSEEFHGAAPRRIRKIPGQGVFLSLGRADEILYSPAAGARRGGWFHKFGRNAKLAVRVDERGEPVPGELVVFYDGEFDPERGIVG